MISTSPSSYSNTTIPGRRPAVSGLILNSRCGFSSSSGPPASTDRAAVIASSSLIPCLRADGATITREPTRARQPGSQRSGPGPHARRAPSARPVPRRRTRVGATREALPARGGHPPAFLQLLNVIARFGLIRPRLNLGVRYLASLNHPLTHDNSVLCNTKWVELGSCWRPGIGRAVGRRN